MDDNVKTQNKSMDRYNTYEYATSLLKKLYTQANNPAGSFNYIWTLITNINHRCSDVCFKGTSRLATGEHNDPEFKILHLSEK